MNALCWQFEQNHIQTYKKPNATEKTTLNQTPHMQQVTMINMHVKMLSLFISHQSVTRKPRLLLLLAFAAGDRRILPCWCWLFVDTVEFTSRLPVERAASVYRPRRQRHLKQPHACHRLLCCTHYWPGGKDGYRVCWIPTAGPDFCGDRPTASVGIAWEAYIHCVS